ncbi:MAG: mandelate racemase/muconate lactonizing enzyme family protein [Candidatus Bathyarchaeota archaeon]|jgi:galactonate dehydratase
MTGIKNWLFVKVETDEDVHGWGEAYTQLDRYRNIEQMVQEISRYLVGRDPFNIKHFTRMVYDDFAGRRGSMDLFCALSGIEQALWDIIGKVLDSPVYNLLGGTCRPKIRVYANGWYGDAKTPDAYADKAVATVKKGFDALKFDPFPGPWRLFISKTDERAAVEVVRAVREAVGSEIDLLIEVHRRLAPMHAVKVARMLEEFDPYWFEEPVPSENLPALAEVRRRVNIPVVTGEALYTKAAFREVFERRAADIINPDVCNCGGILELKEIAAMAEPYYIAVSPHNYNSTTVGLAATIQASACMPNFLITEYFINFEETGNEISEKPFKIEDGYIWIPDEPGLGLELDEEALIDNQTGEQPKRDLRRYHEEGP